MTCSAYVRRDDGALLDHLCNHVAVWSSRLHVRPQEIASAQMHQPKLIHKLGALQAGWMSLRCCPGSQMCKFQPPNALHKINHLCPSGHSHALEMLLGETWVPFPDPGPPSTKTIILSVFFAGAGGERVCAGCNKITASFLGQSLERDIVLAVSKAPHRCFGCSCCW